MPASENTDGVADASAAVPGGDAEPDQPGTARRGGGRRGTCGSVGMINLFLLGAGLRLVRKQPRAGNNRD